ncbi:MAG: TlyA family RNA methyltransferase [Phycisphaerae bacterium]|nr:TlyA family RNA methyltransferase [Phycisphaerae bacterium]
MSNRFVSRAGEKLQGALDAFGVRVAGRVCADFGCNVGGFTDCLLQAGAAKVFAIDTGYGELAWTLRKDPRVAVMERTNALYCDVAETVDLVTIDVAWTPQRLAVPAALRWLKPCPESADSPLDGPLVISLIKPHYEAEKFLGKKPRDVLNPAQTADIAGRVCDELTQTFPCRILGLTPSSILGKGGNREYLALIAPA